jgi:hypothetical protein
MPEGLTLPHGSCLICAYDKPYAAWHTEEAKTGVCEDCWIAPLKVVRALEALREIRDADDRTLVRSIARLAISDLSKSRTDIENQVIGAIYCKDNSVADAK